MLIILSDSRPLLYLISVHTSPCPCLNIHALPLTPMSCLLCLLKSLDRSSRNESDRIAGERVLSVTESCPGCVCPSDQLYPISMVTEQSCVWSLLCLPAGSWVGSAWAPLTFLNLLASGFWQQMNQRICFLFNKNVENGPVSCLYFCTAWKRFFYFFISGSSQAPSMFNPEKKCFFLNFMVLLTGQQICLSM